MIEDNHPLMIRKNSDLVMGRYSFTVGALRLMGIMSGLEPEVLNNRTYYEISTKLFKEYTESSNPYRELYEGANQLYESDLFIKDAETNEYVIRRRVLDEVTNISPGKIRVRVVEDALPIVKGLGKNPILYKAIVNRVLPNEKSLRLYEMFSQVDDGVSEQVVLSFDLLDFKLKFELEKKYPRYTDLKRFMLKTTINNLCDTKYGNIKIKEIKDSRKTVGFKLICTVDRTKQ